jgi:uncharacterized delta-60 repeat protein
MRATGRPFVTCRHALPALDAAAKGGLYMSSVTSFDSDLGGLRTQAPKVEAGMTRHTRRPTRYKLKRSPWHLKILPSVLVGYLALPSPASAAVGQLDLSFGVDGKVTTSFAGDASATAVAIQPNRKIVVVGSTVDANFQADFALARYNRDGSLDQSFDGDGRVTTDFGRSDAIAGVAVQPDGKIVVAGSTVEFIANFQADFALARYNPDGSLDQSFDGDGKVITDFGTPFDGSSGIAIQADGKIVVVGSTYPDENRQADFALARYNPDGSLDQSFDGDGKVTTDFPGHEDATGIAIQSDDRIVVVGQLANHEFALARYNPDGSLDQSFDGDGKVTTDFGGGLDMPADIAVQADGRIVAAGGTIGEASDSDQDFAVARYNPDGSLDQSFDGDGKVTTDFGGHDGPFGSSGGLAIYRNGKIVVAAKTTSPADFSEQDFALARYNPDGSLDQSFDGDGKVITDFGGIDGASAVAIQRGSKAVAAGSTSPDLGGLASFALARYRSG